MQFLKEALRRLYKYFLSPLLHLLAGSGMGCRFEPTCGDYGFQAIKKYGYIKGIWLSIQRVLRCHPFCKGGWDPVP